MPLVLTAPVLDVETAMPPTELLEILIVPGVPVPASIPLKIGLVLVEANINAIEPVADVLPTRLPATVPQLNDPVTIEIPDWAVDALVVVKEIF